VAFDMEVGSDASTQSPTFQDVSGHPGMGSRAWPLPLVPLDPGINGGHYQLTKDKLNSVHPLRGTNIGLPLATAVDQLVKNQRKDATRAVVLFTDGQANQPFGSATQVAREAAVKARDAKIPVYTIGLALTADIKAAQDDLLNDTNNDPS